VACARANGEPFLLMTGAGFDARVVGALDQRWKSRIGKFAYAGPVLAQLVRPLDRLHVLIDGKSHSASWAVIANARHYGGPFVLARKAGIQRRGLHAILFKARHTGVLAGQLLSLALGGLDARAARGSDIEMLPCARARITSPRPVPTQLDGDCFGTTPVEVDEGSCELALIVPAAGGETR
jgi:diacylglycerol kinase family enzyme